MHVWVYVQKLWLPRSGKQSQRWGENIYERERCRPDIWEKPENLSLHSEYKNTEGTFYCYL